MSSSQAENPPSFSYYTHLQSVCPCMQLLIELQMLNYWCNAQEMKSLERAANTDESLHNSQNRNGQERDPTCWDSFYHHKEAPQPGAVGVREPGVGLLCCPPLWVYKAAALIAPRRMLITWTLWATATKISNHRSPPWMNHASGAFKPLSQSGKK